MPEPDDGERDHRAEADHEEGRAERQASHVGILAHAALDLPGRRSVRQCVAYCVQPVHLRRTFRIAVAVGVLLTVINQLDVIVAGEATATTWVKSALNFVVPFVVSNLGLLSATGGR
jgi:hypothetical protein